MTVSATLERPDAQHFTADRKERSRVLPVRITYMIDHLHNIQAGGEQALLRIIRHLPRDKFLPSVVTFKVKPETVRLLREADCPLHVFPVRRTYDWSGLRTAVRIRSLLASERPAIVHTFFETSNTWGGLIAKLSFGPRLISARRDMGVLRSRKHRLAYKLMNRLSDRVLTVSQEVSRVCIEEEKISASKVAMIHNGVDLSSVDRAAVGTSIRSSLNISAASPLIVTVANIRRVKGLDVFIKTAEIVRARFKSAVFLIAGWPNEPEYFSELQAMIGHRGLHDNVRFLGEVENVFPLLKQSDVFCLLSRSEGFSNALLEAMACRLPSVATRVGGNPEAISDGMNGYLVPSDDPQAAADRVLRLLDSPALARDMGEHARRTIESNFTVEIMIDRLVQLYSEVLAVKSSGQASVADARYRSN